MKLTAPDGSGQNYCSTEAIGTGRLEIDNLKADCNYSGQFIWNNGTTTFNLKTLPKPEGKMLDAFSVIADPAIINILSIELEDEMNNEQNPVSQKEIFDRQKNKN